jgi:DNA-binding winged helix-turn-helix (wHTH) protein
VTNSSPPTGYRFGPFLLDLEWDALIASDGSEIRLRPKSLALLRLLVENRGRLLTKDAIMEALWPSVYVTENNVTQCIHDIRQALGAEVKLGLRTYPRRGYAFVADVIVVRGGGPEAASTDQAVCRQANRGPTMFS